MGAGSNGLLVQRPENKFAFAEPWMRDDKFTNQVVQAFPALWGTSVQKQIVIR